MMDFINQLSVTLPPPLFAVAVGIMMILFMFAWGLVLWLLFFIVSLIPGTEFLFVDIEESLNRSIKQNLTQKSKPRGKISRSYRTNPSNRKLQHQLIEMLRGDTAAAKRLLAQQRQINPGRSDNWYLEKVIYDLERDRRC
ncbi:hypothetical protein H6G36_02300 [Anabaena minutissima FACHB-250]|nr:hypothetical protein [Anabaena minutissima FACHB-250]